MTTAMLTRAAAAAKRASGVRAPADRPSHRRNSEPAGSEARVFVPIRDLRIADASDDGIVEFSGYASVTERSYEMWDMFGPYDEIVRNGAFTKTLGQTDLDVPFVIGHNQIRRIARTTTGDLDLAEDTTGLKVAARLALADKDVEYIVPKLRAGLIDEMSFAFRITKGTWSPDWDTYAIEEVDMHRGDVAIVGYGANPYTAGSGLASDSGEGERSAPAPATKRGVDLITEDDIAPRRF